MLPEEVESVQTYIEYMYANGLVMGTPLPKELSIVDSVNNVTNVSVGYNTVSHVPFSHTLFDFKKSSFDNVIRLCPIFNKLMHAIADDYEYLSSSLAVTGQSDEFTGKLLSILQESIRHSAYKPQLVSLGVFRSDYMVQARDIVTGVESLKQVEINTIASSFGGLSTKLTTMQTWFHPELTDHAHIDSSGIERTYDIDNNAFTVPCIPANNPVREIVRGLAAAHHLYLNLVDSQVSGHGSVVLMIVQPGERNFADQRAIEYLLKKEHQITLIRATLLQVHNEATLVVTDVAQHQVQQLVYRGSTVSTVYYRGGYTPDDYTGQQQWAARSLIESSFAIKCPNISVHLAGCKKIQQLLGTAIQQDKLTPGSSVLSTRFHLTHDEINGLRSVFTGLYSLDIEETGEEQWNALKSSVLAAPHAYVMKPQREGGGNNLYNHDIVVALQTLTHEQLNGYILMDRIVPPTQAALLVRGGKVLEESQCICEIGIYGVYLHRFEHLYSAHNASASTPHSLPPPPPSTDSVPLLNYYCGYLLRVKPNTVDEGGVAAGYGVLATVKLVN